MQNHLKASLFFPQAFQQALEAFDSISMNVLALSHVIFSIRPIQYSVIPQPLGALLWSSPLLFFLSEYYPWDFLSAGFGVLTAVNKSCSQDCRFSW